MFVKYAVYVQYLLTIPGSLCTCEVDEYGCFLLISGDVSVMVQDWDLVTVDM